MSAGQRMAATDLERVMGRELSRRGLSDDHIARVVRGLIRTSLRGIDTHGVRLFPVYLNELDGGRAHRRPVLTFETKRRGAALLNADYALGMVAGSVAADRAGDLARENGIGMVTVTNSNHFGAASVYTLAMADRNQIGLCFSNSDALVAAHNGRKAVVGTNPLSFAIREEADRFFCVDMATSQVSFSKVRHHLASGQPVPAGWAYFNEETTPGAASFSALHPLGGYKGMCLGLMVELLCVLLAGTPFDHELGNLYEAPFDEKRPTAHVLIAIDIEAFQPLQAVRQRLRLFGEMIRNLPAEGDEPVRFPGDLEYEAEQDRRRAGIPLDGETAAFFQRLVDDPAPA